MYKEGKWLGELEATARGQFQLVTRAQALDVLSRQQITRLRKAGLLKPLHTGVYALPGAQASWRQRAMAACLAVGPPVATFGLSAAHLWELDRGLRPRSLELIVPRYRNGRCPGVIVHRADLLPGDITARFGIPVTTPARTLLDLSTRLTPAGLGRCLDEALRTHRLTLAELEQRLELAGSRSRRRTGVLRLSLDERAGAYRAGDSPAEDQVYWWIVSAGLPAPARQVQVLVDGAVVLLDLAYPAERIAIEYDSVRHHAGIEAFHADRRRLGALQLAGWIVLPITGRWSRGDVVECVRRALAGRRAGPAEGSGMLEG